MLRDETLVTKAKYKKTLHFFHSVFLFDIRTQFDLTTVILNKSI